MLAIVGTVWLGEHHGNLSWDLFLRRDTLWVDGLSGLAVGLLLVGTWQLGRRLVSPLREVEVWIARVVGPLSRSEILALALISGFSEEVLFRGAVQSSWGWPWSLGIFTLLHSGPARSFRYWTLFALIAGGAFTFLTLSRGTLLPAVVAHVVVNGVNMSLLRRDLESLEVVAQ